MAFKNSRGLIVDAHYTREEVKKPIKSEVTVEKIDTIPGSTSGAGSGDFLQYRNLRRHEQARLEQMEIQHSLQKARTEFELLRDDRRSKLAAQQRRSAKNRTHKKHRAKQFKRQQKSIEDKQSPA